MHVSSWSFFRVRNGKGVFVSLCFVFVAAAVGLAGLAVLLPLSGPLCSDFFTTATPLFFFLLLLLLLVVLNFFFLAHRPPSRRRCWMN